MNCQLVKRQESRTHQRNLCREFRRKHSRFSNKNETEKLSIQFQLEECILPKAGSEKKRPLGIPEHEDKIVQRGNH